MGEIGQGNLSRTSAHHGDDNDGASPMRLNCINDSDDETLDTACELGKVSSQIKKFEPIKGSVDAKIEIEKSTKNSVGTLAGKLKSKEITFHQAYFGYVHHMRAAQKCLPIVEDSIVGNKRDDENSNMSQIVEI